MQGAEDGPSRPKRTRTSRACDYCRSKRLKCEYAPEHFSCRACLRHEMPCQSLDGPPPDDRPRSKRVRRKAGAGSTSSMTPTYQAPTRMEPRFLGATSLSGLIATAWSLFPPDFREQLSNFDSSFSVNRVDVRDDEAILIGRDDGVKQPKAQLSGNERLYQDEDDFPIHHTGEKLSTSIATEAVMVGLLHSYRLNMLPFCPILSLSELCSLDANLTLAYPSSGMDRPPSGPFPPTITKLAVCTLAALSRDVPQSIYRSLLASLSARLDGTEGTQLIRTSSLANVQVLLLLSLSAELHGISTSEGGSLSWLRTGMAVRMAQDIGLHRDVTSEHVPPSQVNRRRRVWAGCVIADRWYALSFGQPMSIDLFDCDACGPSIARDDCINEQDVYNNTDKPYELHAEITKLSTLLGRVLRCAYSPQAMDIIQNSTLHALQEDFDRWRDQLPAGLHYNPAQPSTGAGLLCLISTCVEFLFMRSFERPRRPVPSRLTFRPSKETWAGIIRRSGEAITWLERDGRFLLDTWFIVMYSATWAFFVQLQHYIATRDNFALRYMQIASSCMRDWATTTAHEGTRSLRVKVAVLTETLTATAIKCHETQQAAQVPAESGNPLQNAIKTVASVNDGQAGNGNPFIPPFQQQSFDGSVRINDELSSAFESLVPAFSDQPFDLQHLDSFLQHDLDWMFDIEGLMGDFAGSTTQLQDAVFESGPFGT